MKSQRWCWRFAALAFLEVAIAPLAARAQSSLDEASGVLGVCTASPSAALARSERLRGQAAIAAAAVLPNPALIGTHQRALSGAQDIETVIGLSVPVGIGGRRFVLQRAARARDEQAGWQARGTLLDAALEFREAYVSAIADRARVQVATLQQSALEQLSAKIQGLTRGGEAAGYDLLRETTQSKLHARRLELFRARAVRSRLLLAAWTGEEVSLPDVSLRALAGGDRASAPDPSPRQQPHIESLEAAARASDLEVGAARRRWIPDLEVFAGYRETEVASATGRGLSLGLTVPLTLFDHGQAESARAHAEASVARARAGTLRREQQAAIKASLAALGILEASLGESEQLVADSTEVQLRAERLYGLGEASITELLEAYRSAEAAHLDLVTLAEEAARARLALMRSLGTLFEAKLDRACGATLGTSP
jgi:outer membrane protein, heavy metal efflux system